MAEVSGNYYALDDKPNFKTGHIVVGTTLYEVYDGFVRNCWDLDGGSPTDLAKQARVAADLSNRQHVVIDLEGVYSEDTIDDLGELLTDFEAEDRMDEEELDGLNDLAEYYSNH